MIGKCAVRWNRTCTSLSVMVTSAGNSIEQLGFDDRLAMLAQTAERAYMDILKHAVRTVLRSKSHLAIRDDVPPGRELDLGRFRHAASVMFALAL